MGLGTAAAEGLGKTLQAFGTRLGRLGVKVAPAAERAAASAATKGAPAMGDLILRQAIPSALSNAAFSLLGGASPLSAATAGLMDLGLNVGGMHLAGRYAPGSIGYLMHQKEGKTVIEPQLMASYPQQAVQVASPIISQMAAGAMFPGQGQVQAQQLENVDQTSSIDQQMAQRAYINNMQQQSVSPGTNFQLQGIPQAMDFAPEFGTDLESLIAQGML